MFRLAIFAFQKDELHLCSEEEIEKKKKMQQASTLKSYDQQHNYLQHVVHHI